MSKTPLSLSMKLAAAHLRISRLEDMVAKRPQSIPREIEKQLSVQACVGLYHYDHMVPEELGGPTEPSNLMPMAVLDHRAKTALKDIPAIRKADRVREEHEEFRKRILAKGSSSTRVENDRRSRWPKGRKLRSRPFPKKRTA